MARDSRPEKRHHESRSENYPKPFNLELRPVLVTFMSSVRKMHLRVWTPSSYRSLIRWPVASWTSVNALPLDMPL
jgi:hypothetical protein